MKGPTHLDQWQEAQVTTSCMRIGNWVDDSYQKDVDCQESLKELLRYLRRDNDYFSVRRLLGEYEIIQRHLIPLITSCGDDKGIFNFSLRLLVNLTTPPLLLWREEIPSDRESRSVYLQLKSHQSAFKEAFSSSRFWDTVSRRLQELLNLDWDARQEDDKIQVEMILILVRNALHIPPSSEDLRRTDDDASSHDQVVWALHESGINNLLLYIASSDSEQHLCMHILEVICRMFRDCDASDLASAGKPMSATRREESTKSLVEQKVVEEKMRAQRNSKLSSRHSRFGGVYSVQGVKSVGERDATVTKPNFDPATLAQDHLKVNKRTYGKARKMQEQERPRKSTLAIRLILRDFCIEFMNSAYNTLMRVVKDSIVRHRTMANDESYYLWAFKFFMEFNRVYSFKLDLVSETISVDSFHYVQTCIESYMSNIMTDKRNLDSWNQRMQKAMAAYKELLMTVVALDKAKTESATDLSQHIKSHIFYQMEYRELCLQLLQSYSENKLSRSFLRDLVESSHVFFTLLEKFATKNRHVVVQKKGKAKRKNKKNSTAKKNNTKPDKLTEEEAESLWDRVKVAIMPFLSGDSECSEDIVPFDPASDENMEDQKRTAVMRIHRLMREQKLGEAVGLLRSARSVWPDGDVFASSSSTTEEETEILKEIFFFEFPDDDKSPSTESAHESNNLIDDDMGGSDEEDEEEEVSMPSLTEHEFDFKHYQTRLCSTKIVHALNLQLANYDKESAFTNHATIKMMHRIAWDCNNYAMFFQATLFRTFQRVLRDYRMKIDPAVKEIGKFAHFILRKLEEVSRTNQKVFLELLFPKTNKDAIEIEHGYGTYTSESSKNVGAAWSEEEGFELEQLYDEFKDKDGDVIQMICDAMINLSRTKRQVSKKLKTMGVDVKELAKRSKGHIRPRQEWTENEIIELRELVEKFIDAQDPLGRIVEHLAIKRPKHRVKQKILDLNLVSDYSQLRKKKASSKKKTSTRRKRTVDEFEELIEADEARRGTSAGQSGASGSDSSSSDVSSNSDSDDDAPPRVKHFTAHLNKKGPNKTTQSRSQPSQQTRARSRPFVLEVCQRSLTAAINEGHTVAIQWLHESLGEVITDRETDELNGIHESVPLVPISEEATTAVEADIFLELLAALSLSKPITGQEQYWRVPGSMSNSELQQVCRVIQTAIDGGGVFSAENENEETPAEILPGAETADADDGSVSSPKVNGDDSSDDDVEKNKKRKRARIASDSE